MDIIDKINEVIKVDIEFEKDFNIYKDKAGNIVTIQFKGSLSDEEAEAKANDYADELEARGFEISELTKRALKPNEVWDDDINTFIEYDIVLAPEHFEENRKS
jgi:hypothetical protein